MKRWLKRHPQYHLHFTPTSASWLNQMERVFADLAAKQLRRGVFTSVASLEAAALGYLESRNDEAKLFVWTADVNTILGSVTKYHATISKSGHYNPDMHRRTFLELMGGSMVATTGLTRLTEALDETGRHESIRAVAFDAFPVFDPRSVFRLTDSLLEGDGARFRAMWFPRIFQYTWLRTCGGRYQDFPTVIGEALDYTSRALDLSITDAVRQRLVGAFSELDAWPDAPQALQSLRERGVRLVFLSNMPEAMLRANAERNGIADLFETYLSTDRVQAYKPDPRAYSMGIEALGLPKQQIAFTAFAGWDACGARWFGYPTVWVNRLGAVPESLGAVPQAIGDALSALSAFIAE